MNIEYLSVSRCNTFNTCPLSYRYKYHDKLKSPLGTPEYFTYGTIIHLIAELYVKNKGKSSLQEITNQVLKGEIPINEYKGQITYAPELSPDYKKKLPLHLEEIRKLTNKIGFDGKLEYEFKYDLDPPNRRLFTGLIDRLIQKNKKYWVLDYKTSKANKWRKNEKTITGDLQLKAYCRVVQREFDVDAENIKAGLFYIEKPSKLIAVQFSNKTLKDTETELLKTYKKIETADAAKVWGTTGDHCFMCEWRTQCPFFKGGSQKKQQNSEKKLYDLGLIK
jgi:RecB family exonuclease